MANIKKYYLGSPFPIAAKGVGTLFIIIPITFYLFVPNQVWIFVSPLLVVGLIILFIKQTFLLDADSKKYCFEKSVFGIRFGKWECLENIKGAIIKFRVLSDKTTSSNQEGMGTLNTLGKSIYRSSSNQYEKEDVWTVFFVDRQKQKITVLDGEKKFAVDLLKNIITCCNINIYSGIYRQDRVLSKNELLNGRLVFENNI